MKKLISDKFLSEAKGINVQETPEDAILIMSKKKDYDPANNALFENAEQKSHDWGIFCSKCKEECVMTLSLYKRYMQLGRTQTIFCLPCAEKKFANKNLKQFEILLSNDGNIFKNLKEKFEKVTEAKK